MILLEAMLRRYLIVLLLLTFCLSPFILDFLESASDASNRYAAAPSDHFPYIASELKDSGPIDILFAGTSNIMTSIDAAAVAKALEKQWKRPVVVRNFGISFGRAGAIFAIISDALDKRPVKLLVLEEWDCRVSNAQNPLAFYWLRPSYFAKIWQKLPLDSLVTFYAQALLGVPRRALGLLRKNGSLGLTPAGQAEYEKVAAQFGTHEGRTGYRGSPGSPAQAFVQTSIPAPAIPAAKMIQRNRESDSKYFKPGSAFSREQEVVSEELRKKVEAQGGQFVFLKIGRPDALMEEQLSLCTSQEVGLKNTVTIGVPEAQLLGRMDDSRRSLFLRAPTHRNANGMQLYTDTLIPAIATVFGGNHAH